MYTYQSNLSGIKQAEIEKLEAISKTLALQIDGDLHTSLFNKYSEKDGIKHIEEDIEYYKIHRLLEKTKIANDLTTDIYTLVLKDWKQFEYGVSSSIGTCFRHTLDDLHDVSVSNYAIGGTLGPYNTVNGKWLSAFAPIKNRLGQTVAIVQADQEFDSFIRRAKAEVYREIIYVGVFLIAAFTIMFFFIRKILVREENIKKEIQEKNLIVEEKSRDLMEKNIKVNVLENY
ncbi:MAG: hypothetical protein ACI9AT_000567 [Ulvibacter sp.]